MISKEDKKKIDETLELFDLLISDITIPRNIRKVITDSKERLQKQDEEIGVKVSSIVYSLDSISEDINMPMHARSQIWTILGILESIKKNS